MPTYDVRMLNGLLTLEETVASAHLCCFALHLHVHVRSYEMEVRELDEVAENIKVSRVGMSMLREPAKKCNSNF